jgi:hypothetical protein
MESGFVKYRRNGRTRFAALWTDSDRVAKYDRPLGSRRDPATCREDEGELRLGVSRLYGVRGDYIYSGECDSLERIAELQSVAEMTLNGESFAAGWHGEHKAAGIVPLDDSERGHFFCGGEVQAELWLAGYDPAGLPFVRLAYVSRDHSGRLAIAIPA